VNAGFADHVLISSDFYSQQALKTNGGPGLGQAATVFGPRLLKAGLPETTLRRILVDNPRRFLAFVPRSA
jgi:phosphotriesterase-related protein